MTASAKGLRVLMTADTVGGVWTFAIDLAAALVEQGCDVTIATMGAPLTAAQQNEVRALRRIDVVESRYRLEWMSDPWSDVDRAGDWLLALAEKYRPDIVHLNGYSHAALPWRVPTIVTAHSCVCSWWRAVRGEEAPPAWNEYRRRVTTGLAAADLVVAPSRAMLNELRNIYTVRTASRVISNARDFRPFRFAPKKQVILSAGRIWDEAKNISALDAIAPQVRWPIELAGDCTHPDGASARLTNIHCLGQLSTAELATRLSTAAIFALPARYEPFGLTIVEAGLSGCALVLGDISSLREIWGNTAVFINPEDHQELVTTLDDLASDHRRRGRMAERARVRAWKIASHDVGGSYVAAYQSCLQRQPQEVAA